MRLLPMDSFEPGMRLARPIRRPDGILLLAQGTVLDEEHMASLKRQQVAFGYVEEDHVAEAEIPSVVTQELKAQAQEALHSVISSIAVGQTIDSRPVMHVVDTVVEEIVRNREALVALVEARALETELMEHSVSVAVLTVLLGLRMGLSRHQLQELGTGALLHDLGKLRIPSEILYKPGTLTPEEMRVVQEHPTFGFELARKVPNISLLSAHVAVQHQERLDGPGYPRGLVRREIHPYAAICAVADVFDSMTSTRSYRQAFHPALALYWIRTKTGTLFHEDVVRVLRTVVAPYPIATMVRLKTGEICVVEDVKFWAIDKPRVRLVRDKDGHPVQEGSVLDLSQRPDLVIAAPWTSCSPLRRQNGHPRPGRAGVRVRTDQATPMKS